MLHIFSMFFKLPMLARGPRLFELFILDPMLETLLFIAAASAIPLMAKARRVNEVSRRFPIIGKVCLLWYFARRLLLKLPQ